jgi:nicotinate phosphoribosyltransferase
MANVSSTGVALHTDLYQLTMAAGYFHRGLAHTRASCEMFVRSLPKPRRYLVACGVDAALDAIADLRFEEEQIAWLREVPALRDAMHDGFADYLRAFRFRGDIVAVEEGTVMFGGEPFLRVDADIIEAQLVETFLLSVINHGTMVASKAARIVHAAQGRDVLEFGTRRTHPSEAVDAARAAYLVGAAGTSNLEAGKRYGIPVMGTAAHMWVMTHDSEADAFANYVATFPDAAILLIDTYDTVRGAELAAQIAGDRLSGVRLDSGDLLALSKQVRQVLDDRGCRGARIVASGDLNEYAIERLLAAGAPIDVFGVGTELVTSKDAPSLGGVYKVVQFERDGRVVPIAKLSEGKATYPGQHQVYRRFDGDSPVEDVLALVQEPAPPGATPLLRVHTLAGQRVADRDDLDTARRRAMAQLAALPEHLHQLDPMAPGAHPVTLSSGLQALVKQVQSA